MNEEAGFIQALLADPDDRTVLLVYADWLDERSDPRGEYIRLLATTRPNRRRLAALRRSLDRNWCCLIDSRHLRVGSRVRVTHGVFAEMEADVIALCIDRLNATVRMFFWGRPVDVDLPVSDLERIEQ